jgi:hypothetical protein
MKRSYMVWKKESISDDIIFKELAIITRGKAEVPEGLKLGDFRDVLATPMQQNNKGIVKKRPTFKRK